MKRALVIGAGVLLAAGAAGTTAAVASGDDDVTVTGSEAQRATAAALDITGGGHANSVERDSENGATWEVEVTRPDGVTVDVRLDEQLALVVVERDGEDGQSGG